MDARTPVETIQAAIEKLDVDKTTLGLMVVVADGDLLALADDDVDDDGNHCFYGLNLQGVDSDLEINEAIVTLHRTIDAQLEILRDAVSRAAVDQNPAGITIHYRHAISLAAAILGEGS